MQENSMQELKAALTVVCGSFTAVFGWMGWLVLGWVCCMALDFLTGCMAAGKNGKWKSQIAREGLWHKAGMIVAVGAAAGTDGVLYILLENIPAVTLPFSYTVLVCPLVLVWYILTELGSITENAAALGAPLPAFLVRILEQLHTAVEESEISAKRAMGNKEENTDGK